MEVSGHLTRLGKYRLRGELGRGAMGVVYRAWDETLEREVALKTMTAPDADPEQTERFLREARTAGSLHHRNIVVVHELGTDSGTHYIAMELMDGTDLNQLLKAGRVPALDRRLDIVARVCDGLEYAHRAGIVHRDVKPGNVFLASDGAVKILDFGIAKITTSDATRTGMVIGTVDYMSPEQVRAEKSLDGRSDLFSAGVILYELLFGRRPFSAGDLGATLHRILNCKPPGEARFEEILPPGLGEVLRRALHKNRENRFASAAEMAAALDRVRRSLTGGTLAELDERISKVIESAESNVPADDDPGGAREPSPARAAPVTPLEAGRGRMRPWLRGALAAGLAVLALGAAVLVGSRWRSEEAPVSDPATTATAEPAPAESSIPQTDSAIVAGEPSSAAPPTALVEATGPPEPSAKPVPVGTKTPPDPDATSPAAIDRAAARTEAPADSKTDEPAVSHVAPVPTGALDVLVMPWARVAWIEDLETGTRASRDESTPVRLELPAGKYRLHLLNPHAAGPLDVDVVVRDGRTGSIRRTMPGFDAAELAREILGVEVAGGSTP